MKELLRIGFIGCGMVAELHHQAISRSRVALLAGVTDIDHELTLRRATEWSCPRFESIDAMLASDEIDAVYVLSPTAHHIELARRALDTGKHVLVEKPVSREPREIAELVELAAARGLVCMPAHNYAYWPEYQRIKRQVDSGTLGTIRLASTVFSIAHTEEVAAHYDGALWTVMPHHVYLTHGLLGMPARVTAGSTKPAWGALERDDQWWMVLDYPPHGTAMLFATMGADDDSADPWTFMVKVLGTDGSASATWRAAVVHRGIGSMSTGFVPYEETYEAELEAFVAAVGGDGDAIVSPLASAESVAIIIGAAARSAREGRTVELGGGSRGGDH
ncbi:MAG TPA: Gfo/Idh/MocA family oxidoreductase [Pseudolysinimonas sp.]